MIAEEPTEDDITYVNYYYFAADLTGILTTFVDNAKTAQNQSQYVLISEAMSTEFNGRVRAHYREITGIKDTDLGRVRMLRISEPDTECDKVTQHPFRSPAENYISINDRIDPDVQDLHNGEIMTEVTWQDIWNNNQPPTVMENNGGWPVQRFIEGVDKGVITYLNYNKDEDEDEDEDEDDDPSQHPDTVKRGWCGDCWICCKPVWFYRGRWDTTICGQCEHIGAIVATFAAALTAAETTDASIDPTNAVSAYGTSHVWCNQVKSDLLTMKLTEIDGWQPDDITIRELAERVVGGGMTNRRRPIPQGWYNEYDPEHWSTIGDWITMRSDRDQRQYLTEVQRIIDNCIYPVIYNWCVAANTNMRNVFSENFAPEETWAWAATTRLIMSGLYSSRDRFARTDAARREREGRGRGRGRGRGGRGRANKFSRGGGDDENIFTDQTQIINRALGVTINNEADFITVATKLYGIVQKNENIRNMLLKYLKNLKEIFTKNVEKYAADASVVSVGTGVGTGVGAPAPVAPAPVAPAPVAPAPVAPAPVAPAPVSPAFINKNMNSDFIDPTSVAEINGGNKKRNTKKRNTKKRNNKKRNTKKRNTKKRNTKKRNTKK